MIPDRTPPPHAMSMRVEMGMSEKFTFKIHNDPANTTRIMINAGMSFFNFIYYIPLITERLG